MERKVKKLSCGELQRVAIALTLGANADLHRIDEASVFLDAEQRVVIAKIIKRYAMNTGKTAFIVGHDFIQSVRKGGSHDRENFQDPDSYCHYFAINLYSQFDSHR
jgi:ABC-type Mn2+/Zn2+ transport system ATPase subunit